MKVYPHVVSMKENKMKAQNKYLGFFLFFYEGEYVVIKR